jgi:hypothetical protein
MDLTPKSSKKVDRRSEKGKKDTSHKKSSKNPEKRLKAILREELKIREEKEDISKVEIQQRTQLIEYLRETYKYEAIPIEAFEEIEKTIEEADKLEEEFIIMSNRIGELKKENDDKNDYILDLETKYKKLQDKYNLLKEDYDDAMQTIKEIDEEADKKINQSKGKL